MRLGACLTSFLVPGHPMILFRLRACLLILAAGLSSAGQSSAQSVDDPKTGGTFNTPTYSPTPTPRQNAGTAGTTAPNPTGQGGTGTNARPMAPQNGSTDGTSRRRFVDLPPPKPSEFQKFVEAATGRLLPAFGAGFFSDPNENLLGPDNVPVSADYIVGPGDEIVLRAWGSIDVDYRSTVDRNGQLSLPKIGSFNVAGVKASELEKHLRAQIGRLFTNFNLSASLGQLRAVKVFVVGPAQRPGVYTLPSQSTMLSALVAAGGPAPNGSMRKVTLRRDGRVVSELDLYDFLVQGDKSKDIQLAAGDVVVLQAAGARVAVTGAIDSPAIYELKGDSELVREVLRFAGGAPVLANPNRAQLERIDATQAKARFVEEFKLDTSGLQKSLRDGDVLTLLAISPQFANAVTLKGAVAQPLRYAHKPGMRIRDLIPDREALVSPDFYRRKNLLVQVLEPEDSQGRREAPDRAEINPSANRDVAGNGNFNANPVGGGNANNPNAPTFNANNGNSGTERGAQRPRQTMEGDDDRAVSTRPRKTPTTLFEELNWDYAVIERLVEKDLTTQVIPFNLGKAVLQGDDANNLELLPGDVVTIYSQKDVRVPVARQTRLVALEGEIVSPGVYQLQPGETLKGLIARAGGLTAQAYVYGLDFSREETRQRQRENLNAAIARLESLSATQSARDAANRRDDTSAASTSAVSNAATQAQLTRLTRLQPNGRIALELSADARTLEELPDVPLEHGDRISVPSRPGFVTVAGAVVNNNAFLWKPGRTAGDYLKLAGLDEAAEPANMFILRADGTVSHAGDRRSFFGGSKLESDPMQPGDALIVPNQLDFETWGRALVRNLKDWSQIFSQFGLGAAAIQTLRN
jgi:protein involved in polysaccharide export with SLBB domain